MFEWNRFRPASRATKPASREEPRASCATRLVFETAHPTSSTVRVGIVSYFVSWRCQAFLWCILERNRCAPRESNGRDAPSGQNARSAGRKTLDKHWPESNMMSIAASPPDCLSPTPKGAGSFPAVDALGEYHLCQRSPVGVGSKLKISAM
jgi:hypothetical protein